MKKKKEETQEGIAPWVLTYSDTMTLLLCFFVVLMSFSTIQETKFKQTMGSIQDYLGLLISPNYSIMNNQFSTNASVVPKKVQTVKKAQGDSSEKLDETYLITIKESMKKDSDKKGLGGSIEYINELNSLRIRMPSVVCFDRGGFEITDTAKQFFVKVADLVKDIPYQLTIEGHTDDTPIYSDTYKSNWELSFERAMVVLRYLNQLGVDNKRLAAIAYGEHHPIASNSTMEGKKLNRRVEIVISYDKITENEND